MNASHDLVPANRSLHVPCPACGRMVRVTPEEQSRKRTFCAACDSRFEIDAELVGSSPFRSAPALALIPASPAPPTRLIVMRGDSAGELVLRSAWPRVHLGLTFGDLSRGTPSVLLFLLLTCVAGFVKGYSNVELGYLVFPVMALLVIAWWLVASLVRRDVVTTDGETLVVRQGSVATRIPFGDIVDVRIDTEVDVSSASGASFVLRIVRDAAATVTLGRGFGYDRRVTAWLKAWIDARLARRAL